MIHFTQKKKKKIHARQFYNLKILFSEEKIPPTILDRRFTRLLIRRSLLLWGFIQVTLILLVGTKKNARSIENGLSSVPAL